MQDKNIQIFSQMHIPIKIRIGFDNLWLGFIYTGDSIADLIPQITFQTAVVQREKAINQTKNFYLKSQSLQASLRG
ncbi:hypothetical protein U5980_000747 [Campylobacter coli]|nr:hypothetical protein [Campylobacter coli]EMA9399465.1 hypothetical protein [Campylobacter coli]